MSPGEGAEIRPPLAVDYGTNIRVGAGSFANEGPVGIGADTVVGAGDMVARDLPSGVLAFGNPARVVRRLGQQPAGRHLPARRNCARTLALHSVLVVTWGVCRLGPGRPGVAVQR